MTLSPVSYSQDREVRGRLVEEKGRLNEALLEKTSGNTASVRANGYHCNKTDATDGDPISSGIDARAKRRKSAKAVPRRSPSGPG